jgi:hypothetical protein
LHRLKYDENKSQLVNYIQPSKYSSLYTKYARRSVVFVPYWIQAVTSVIGSRALPGLSYQTCAQKLYAANATAVPIAGSAELHYSLGRRDMKYEVLVSEAFEEIYSERDWLKEHN